MGREIVGSKLGCTFQMINRRIDVATDRMGHAKTEMTGGEVGRQLDASRQSANGFIRLASLHHGESFMKIRKLRGRDFRWLHGLQTGGCRHCQDRVVIVGLQSLTAKVFSRQPPSIKRAASSRVNLRQEHDAAASARTRVTECAHFRNIEASEFVFGGNALSDHEFDDDVGDVRECENAPNQSCDAD